MNSILKYIQKPLVVHLLVLALVTLYWSIRMTAFSALGDDEAEQVLFAQSFQWGYDVSNPPLYTWILIGLFSLFGKSAGLVIGFKLALLALVYFALYQAARISLAQHRTLDVALVTLSPLLIFFVAWHAVFSYSHSLLNALFVILTYSAAIKLFERPNLQRYAIFGVVLGLGMLTKYTYGLFVLGLLGAALTMPRLRRHFLSPYLLVSLGVAAVILVPHGAWLMGAVEQVQQAVSYKLQTHGEASYLAGVGKGLWNIVRAAFAFMSPLWIIVLLVFPALIKAPQQAIDAPQAAGVVYARQLLERTFLAILGLMVAMVLVGGITQFRPNYLFLMMLFPLWVFLRIPAGAVPGKRRQIYVSLILAAGLLSVGGLAVKAISDPINCKKCQLLVPYESLAETLKARGFTGGTLFATWHPVPLAGNLALYLPEARVVSKKFLAVRPPARSQPGQCLSLWVPQEQGGPDSENAIGSTEGNFDIFIGSQAPVTRLTIPLYRAADKHLLIDYLLLDPGSGDCQ